MSEEAGLAFVIDGREFPSPALDSLNMGERRVMYDLCGIVQEDFAPQDGEDEETHDARVSKMVRHPGFMESLMTIAYQRGNPSEKPDKVRQVIERTNYLEAIEAWAESVEADDQVPLALTSSPDAPSSSETDSSNGRSGEGSPNGSALPDGIRAPTGTGQSATSPTSRRVTLHT